MKVAIIGAGPAGLAAGWELKTQGVSVDLFEAHSKPGGCASYFRRSLGDEKVLFDAGATVLWELDNGAFLKKQLDKWKISTPPFHRHSFHRFTMNGKSFELNAASNSAWIDSLAQNFPQDKVFIEKNFPDFFKTAQHLNHILYKVPAHSFLNFKNIYLNSSLFPELIKVGIDFIKYPRKFSDLIKNTSEDFQCWVKMFLLISLQANIEEVESLYGIAALCFFPLSAGALEGGMASYFDPLAQNFNSPTPACHLYFKTHILKILSEKGYLLCTSDKVLGPYTHVILSCPRWNSVELFQQKLFEELPTWENMQNKLWSAVVAYIAIEDNKKLPDKAYNHQVKTDEGEFYFSVSMRGDTKRSSSKWRIITASTHESINQWKYPDYQKKKDFPSKAEYENQKLQWSQKFKNAANKIFNQDVSFIEIASPKTFLHYTKRKEGFVGGIPLTSEFSYLNTPSQETLLPNVYQIGDTSFPGQSVVNCTIGALEVVRKVLAS